MDIKTVLISYLITNAICMGVIGALYWQNRKQFKGLGFWLADFIMQFVALLLATMRGVVPDFISMVIGNGLVIGGTILLYVGLEQFTGKRGPQWHNAILFILFISVHSYFTVVSPNLTARNINLALALFAICAHCAWLLLHRVDVKLRPITRDAGLIFAAYCLVNAVRIFIDLAIPSGKHLFTSNLYDTSAVMTYQMLFIALTFSLFLAVNRRLTLNLQEDLIKRQEIEEILRFSKEKFFKAFHSSPDSVTITRLSDGRFVEVNEGFSRITGYARDEALGMTAGALQLWATPQDREVFLQTLQREQVVREMECHYRVKSGATRDGLLSAEILQLGNEPHIITIIHDITDRRQAEFQREAALEKLQEGEERLRLAVSAGSMGIWDRNFITGLLNWSVECKAMFGLPPEIEMNDEYFMNALHPDDRLPIDIAIREAQAKRSEFNAEYRVIWPDGTLHWIAALGRWHYDEAGQAVRMTGVTLDITERKRMEEALRISEERYRNFIAQSFEAISRTEFDHPIDITLPVEEQIDRIYENAFMAECNQAMADMYHVPSPQAFAGMRLIDAHGGKDDPINRETFRKLIKNGYKSVNDETKEYTIDGKPLWFLNNTIGMVENGYLVRLWSTAIDITEQKLTREALEERTRFTNKLLDATALSTWISDAHGTAIQANPAYYQFFGATEAEVIGKYNVFQDNVAEQQGAMPLIKRAYETGELVTFFLDYDFGEASHVKVKNATHKFVKVMLTPILDPQGNVSHVVSQSIDLTEIKQSEAALRASEERFRGLITSAPDAVFVVDQKGKITFANMEATNLFGYTLDEFIGMEVEKLIPQKLREGHMVNRAKYMGDPRARLMGAQLNLIAIHKRGSEIPVDIKLSPVHMEAGIQVVAFIRDITERKQTEVALRLEQEFVNNALDNQQDTFFLFDFTSGKALRWNRAFREISGYSDEEIAALPAPISYYSTEDLARENYVIQQIMQGEPASVVMDLICKDGRKITTEYQAAPLKDEKGEYRFIIAIGRDITERKRTETDLLQANKALMMLHEMLREQTIRDPLTNLHNRRYLNEILEHEAARAERENYPISVMLIDIDHFKNFNDTYGHSAGDEVLKSLSHLLVNSIRQGDIACRYGGEEFLVVMIAAHETDVERRAEAIRSDFSKLRIRFEQTDLSATISIGIAFYPKHDAEIQQVIGAADTAMYQAKQAGRNRIQVWRAR